MYVGRFAPSPSGGLHFGSLLTALGSFLDARSHKGKWLLRIDDIDPPREISGASDKIQSTLKAFAMDWDEEVIFQSHRYPEYVNFCIELIEKDLAYPCTCSRKEIAKFASYPGHCRKILSKPQKQSLIDALRKDAERVQAEAFSALKPVLGNFSLRFNAHNDFHERALFSFNDLVQGKQIASQEIEDFIIFRKDRLPSYMLACAFDDNKDAVNHLVRGADLLDSCFWQRQLQAQLNLNQMQSCAYAHLPVIENEFGQKLSKQHHAPEIHHEHANELLAMALQALNHPLPPELINNKPKILLQWAIENWDIQKVNSRSQGFQDIKLQ